MDDDHPTLFDAPPAAPAALDPDRDYSSVSGRFFGLGSTTTERASGVAVELRENGELKPDGAGHRILREYRLGDRMPSYEAAFRATGNHHFGRREARRLLDRGFLTKDGTMRNPAPGGRAAVDAYRITPAGLAELARLGS